MKLKLFLMVLQVLEAFYSSSGAYKKDILSKDSLTVSEYKIRIDASSMVNKLDHFWKSTGFCPPDPHKDFNKFMATNDISQNLIYMGSVPNRGLQQVRIHFLLDLVEMHRGSDGGLVISFENLDKALDILKENWLRPGFELMGNPSSYFTNFDDDKQIYEWMELIKELGVHLIERYGLNEVARWNFESWNEPFSRIAFIGLNVSMQGYLNYYDACSEGLRMASPMLRLGGPATGNPLYHEKSSKTFYTFLRHCYDGINFITGHKGVRLDFISFHIKGQGTSSYILETEQAVLDQIQRMFPRFAGIPVFNDEADPLVGWNKIEEWRADARYAAVVVKIISQHQNQLIPNKKSFSLLSNDNGFMSYHPAYFSQRTLLARFQINNTQPHKVEFIKKPILGAMALLALLGDQQVSTEIVSIHGNQTTQDVGVIASTIHATAAEGWELSALFYNSNDTENTTGLAIVDVDITGIPVVHDILYVIYRIDNYHGNPYSVWAKMGSPVFPTNEQLEIMRLNQPSYASAFRVSSNEILVYWKYENQRCIKTYQVLYSSTERGLYEVVNKVDLIFCAFHHTTSDRTSRGGLNESSLPWYKIRAVDYWSRIGKETDPFTLPSELNTMT